MSSLKVYSQPLGDFATNAYMIVKGDKAIAIDAPPGSYSFYKKLITDHQLQLEYLLLTHSHFDHIADAKDIQEMGVKVGVHPKDMGNCIRPGSDRLPLMMPVKPFTPDFELSEQDIVLGDFEFKIFESPGHTPGGILIQIEQLLFTGDTLFHQAIGNLSFPTSDVSQMSHSLKKLFLMNDDLKIYPGHGPSSFLKNEKSYINQMIHVLGTL